MTERRVRRFAGWEFSTTESGPGVWITPLGYGGEGFRWRNGFIVRLPRRRLIAWHYRYTKSLDRRREAARKVDPELLSEVRKIADGLRGTGSSLEATWRLIAEDRLHRDVAVELKRLRDQPPIQKKRATFAEGWQQAIDHALKRLEEPASRFQSAEDYYPPQN